MKKSFLFYILCLSISLTTNAQTYKLLSPNKKLEVSIDNNNVFKYSIRMGEKTVIAPSQICLKLNNYNIALNQKVKSVKLSYKMEHFATPFYRQDSIKTDYNQLRIVFDNKTGVIFRAYNEGVAYRFFSERGKGVTTVDNEIAQFNFEEDYKSWIPYSTNPKQPYNTCFQSSYIYDNISKFKKDNLAFLPLTVDLRDGIKATLMEAELYSYPGMFIKAEGNMELIGDFAKYPKDFEIHPVRCMKKVKNRYEYISRSANTREYPWRIIAITTNDAQLPNNPMVYALSSPCKIKDVSWIKPGKIAWDWWNDWSISNVDFKVGINTTTYKYFIDFASKHGIEYVVLDEGWSNPSEGNIMKTIPEINIKELVDYGKSKNVGIILWSVLNVLDDKLEEACSYYSKLGVKGFKVDFLDRDDQEGIDMFYRVAAKTAEHKLLLDFHGAPKPTGYTRTFPNVINVEGVYGLEELKWSNPNMPEYDVTMPFIRMACGPVDYTQGAMRNATKKDFRDVYNLPMSQGTRAHQVAEYVAFDSPLVTLCDSPTMYYQNEKTTDYIASIPTTFDETIILKGEIGKYIVTARRKDNNWYIGALSNWDSRDIEIPLSFIKDDNNHSISIFSDGINADKIATDYKIETKTVNRGDVLKLHLSQGGGCAMIIK